MFLFEPKRETPTCQRRAIPRPIIISLELELALLQPTAYSITACIPHLVHLPDGHKLVHRRSAHRALPLVGVVHPALHARAAEMVTAVV